MAQLQLPPDAFRVFRRPTSDEGLFFSFEGIEGSGKSTQIKKMSEHLVKRGYHVSLFREPGATEWGEQLRSVILGQKNEVDALAQCLLFLSARAQLLSEKVLPLLRSPKNVVILDRYIDSTLCYQGFAGQLPLSSILHLHSIAPLYLLPHRTIYLDIDLDTSFQRQKDRGNQKDFFESKPLEFYQKLLEGHRLLANHFKERFIWIDGKKSMDEIELNIKNEIDAFLAGKNEY